MNAAPPVLTDHRIQSMRSTVMNVVDEDITRRGRRARNVVGLAAASVLVVGFGSVGLNALEGGGGAARDSASSESAARPGSNQKSDSLAPQDAARDKNAPGPSRPEREVITTGSIQATVKKPREVAQRLSTYVGSVGGRVESRNEGGNGENSHASLQIRVPSTKVNDTVRFVGTLGSVENVSLQNSDVTSDARDLGARIRALRLSINRLEGIIADANTSAELIQGESALTERQEQLESLVAQRKAIADQVELSTIQVDLAQKAKADTVSSGGFGGGLLDGWNALVSTVNHIVEVAGVLLPWAALAGILFGAYRLVSRRRRTS